MEYNYLEEYLKKGGISPKGGNMDKQSGSDNRVTNTTQGTGEASIESL